MLYVPIISSFKLLNTRANEKNNANNTRCNSWGECLAQNLSDLKVYFVRKHKHIK